ncbi:glycosyltransferase [Helcobacillus massiliensis]|uniref:D-inositol 3-phosphate glycosyltransferase n=1 Tax=Helcobacillus massiliensis TaxID=521392 RepID=A0A839QQA5_9MICO|nr:glycosyltransferase [Helcobacillus massiliensis]MBB3021955.1 glycosyltransferase involved in cell wall biosynthesis [Helcobacillus massiliensis]
MDSSARIALSTALLAIPPTYFVTEHAEELRRRGEPYSFAVVPLAARVDPGTVTTPVLPALTIPRSYRTRSALAKFAMPLQARTLTRLRPDLIHQHHGTWSSGARSAARALDVPLVTTLHGTDVVHALRSDPRGLQRVHRKQVQQAFRDSDLLLAVSEHQRRLALRAGAPADRLHVHYQGIDTEYFSPDTSGIAEDRPRRLLYVGGLIPRKRVDLAIDASIRAHGTLEHELLIVGDGPERSALEAKAEDHPHIRFLGAQSRAGVRELMRSSDLLLLLSHSEGAGLVILEAQACGMAAVVTGGDGKAEMVEDGVTGRVITGDSPTPDDAARAILEWTPQDTETRRQISRTARSFVVEKRSVRRGASELDGHYCSLLSR